MPLKAIISSLNKTEIAVERMYGKKELAKAVGQMIDDRALLKEQLG